MRFQTAIILFYASIGVKEGRPFRFIFPNMIRMESKPTRPEVRKHWSSNRWLLTPILFLTCSCSLPSWWGWPPWVGLGFVPKNLPRLRYCGGRRAHGQARKGGCRQSQTNVGVTGKTASKPKRSSRAKGVPRIRPERPLRSRPRRVRARESPKLPKQGPAKKTPRKAVRKKESPNDEMRSHGSCFSLFWSGCRCSFRNGQPESLLADGVLCMTGSFVAGVLTLLQAIDSPDHEVSYVFGGWIIDSFPRGVGIEFRADLMAALITLIVLGVVCALRFMQSSGRARDTGKEHFSSPFPSPNNRTGRDLHDRGCLQLLLIEVAALTGYGLIAMGGNGRCSHFQLRILGTIGASLYLLGVGTSTSRPVRSIWLESMKSLLPVTL